MGQEPEAELIVVVGRISEALITTMMWILVAIPAVWGSNHFTSHVQGVSIPIWTVPHV